jgi:putative addiction module component (TIGR02574 family)
MSHPAFDFSKLSPQQRLELIGELWDSLEDELPPLEPEMLAELDRRLAEFAANPAEGRPAAEVIARVRATLR